MAHHKQVEVASGTSTAPGHLVQGACPCLRPMSARIGSSDFVQGLSGRKWMNGLHISSILIQHKLCDSGDIDSGVINAPWDQAPHQSLLTLNKFAHVTCELQLH